MNKAVYGAAISVSLVMGGSAIVADAQQPAPAPTKILVAAGSAQKPAVAPANTAADKPLAAKPVAKKKKLKAKPDPVPEMMTDVADWIGASGDNRGMPYAVIDKVSAQIIVYAADNKVLGRAPVLIGSAAGDGSAPSVGDREISDIPMEDRTTPAGRYLVAYGPAYGHTRVLWVDYVNSIALHAIAPTKASAREKRTQRINSKTPDDNRITHGCINVSPAFYSKTIKTTFKKGGVFYVLPDTETLQEAIPAYGLDSVEAIAALEAADPVVPFSSDDEDEPASGAATPGE